MTQNKFIFRCHSSKYMKANGRDIMRKALIFFLLMWAGAATMAQNQAAKQKLLSSIDQQTDRYSVVARKIWEYAELGYQEKKSSDLLQSELKKSGFAVTAGVGGMPTAFTASYGQGHPIIGILAEFDALPGLSQDAVPEKKVLVSGSPGHACGHNLFGTGSVAAAIAIKEAIQTGNIKGTIRVYGTPAEEGGAGKVYMVRAGLFSDADVVLHWHPGDGNSASASSSLANKSAKFRFYGVASHASSAPEQGRSALDGVEALDYMVNMMREHIPSDARIHYVITKGGDAPNVVPAFAEVYYYVRHPVADTVKSLFERIVKAAQGAALGTGTRMDYEVIHGVYNVLPNETLSLVMDKNLHRVGGVNYDEQEKDFAAALQRSLIKKEPLLAAQTIQPFRVIEKGSGGSTDVGDVSWVVPTAGLSTATFVPGTPGHSWQAVAAAGMSIGNKGMIVAAKTLALTAYDIFTDPSIIKKAQQELQKRREPDFRYESLVGNREVPLNYRDN